MPAALQANCVDYESSPYDPGSLPLVERRREWSWPYQILPFIEQDNLYRTASDTTVKRTPVKIYNCPTRRRAQLYRNHSVIDYAGCAGTRGDGTDGMVVRQGMGPVSFAAVTDGLSNTVMAGEKRVKKDKFGFATDDNESWAAPGWDSEVFRRAVRDTDRPTGDRGPSRDVVQTTIPPFTAANQNSGLAQFGSSHASGANVLLGDGSVRHIRFNPTPTAFQRFCVKDDGRTFDPNGM
jgi:prepilin-type processing-associated H-X9-DG protein